MWLIISEIAIFSACYNSDMEAYEEAYKGLNKEQKLAVDTIEGPVMVVAGPGTGKTQVLALRIANILQKTDNKADSILSLTFTRSGVGAMRARLARYIGTTSRDVKVATFHSFANELVDKYFTSLDFDAPPTLLDDTEAILFVDALLHDNDWEYIRPRSNPALYFSDLRSLISILKRERMTPANFLSTVDDEIKSLEQDPESISSRGASKGELKKEIVKKIESLKRTKEVVEFYRLYEEKKREAGVMDYDDVLEYAVKIAENDDNAREEIRVNYQYVLIDEHQDSSGIQNSFLKAVWQDTEKPNIFVVGDDRQLIYGFSGASLSYFEEFSHLFGKTKLITLIENYRSTQNILALADDLLKSSITNEKLNSNKSGNESIGLLEYSYERDEIIGAGKFFKDKIAGGVSPSECALLVPKNHHVRTAINILRDMGLPVASLGASSIFILPEVGILRRALKIISDPYDHVSIAESLLDKYSNISPIEAHQFLHKFKYEDITLEHLINKKDLFSDAIALWGETLSGWIKNLSHERLSYIISVVGNELFINNAKSSEEMISLVEILRSILHASIVWEEKNPKGKLKDFLEYLDRLEEYGSHIELATFGGKEGIHVMTLHKSKGLEYENVWIAHMNEETLMSEKKSGFTLPETIKSHMAERDIESAKRELYVAITRAKSACNISYANRKYSGVEVTISRIIEALSELHFTKKTKEETEKELLKDGPEKYVSVSKSEMSEDSISEIKDFVKNNFSDVKVSVTLLNNFFSCPWKWYFRNFLRLPEVKSASLALGSIVHGAIEFTLKSKSKPTKAMLKKVIEDIATREHVEEGKEFSRMTKEALEATEGWIEKYYADVADERESEKSISFKDPKFPNLQMYGKIDLLEKGSDGIMVTDFKTGSAKTASAIEKISDEGKLSDLMRQLVMYSYLIQGSGNGHVSNSRLLFVEHIDADNEIYETEISEEQIEILRNDIAEYQDNLLTGDWTDRECDFKPFGGVTECPYCKIAKNFTSKN
jgi:DNA helicase-2/ATP-dependent DNA helicase PcrA